MECQRLYYASIGGTTIAWIAISKQLQWIPISSGLFRKEEISMDEKNTCWDSNWLNITSTLSSSTKLLSGVFMWTLSDKIQGVYEEEVVRFKHCLAAAPIYRRWWTCASTVNCYCCEYYSSNVSDSLATATLQMSAPDAASFPNDVHPLSITQQLIWRRTNE